MTDNVKTVTFISTRYCQHPSDYVLVLCNTQCHEPITFNRPLGNHISGSIKISST